MGVTVANGPYVVRCRQVGFQTETLMLLDNVDVMYLHVLLALTEEFTDPSHHGAPTLQLP